VARGRSDLGARQASAGWVAHGEGSVGRGPVSTSTRRAQAGGCLGSNECGHMSRAGLRRQRKNDSTVAGDGHARGKERCGHYSELSSLVMSCSNRYVPVSFQFATVTPAMLYLPFHYV
jgi:hypothetical protein